MQTISNEFLGSSIKDNSSKGELEEGFFQNEILYIRLYIRIRWQMGQGGKCNLEEMSRNDLYAISNI